MLLGVIGDVGLADAWAFVLNERANNRLCPGLKEEVEESVSQIDHVEDPYWDLRQLHMSEWRAHAGVKAVRRSDDASNLQAGFSLRL